MLPDEADPLLMPGAQPGPPDRGWWDMTKAVLGHLAPALSGKPGLADVLAMPSAVEQFAAAEAAAPHYRPGMRLTEALAGPVPFANPALLALGAGSIRAFHGSPHDFPVFDISKIGTGEGAQAYGHGLYFAEREPVAQSYRPAGGKSSLLGPNDEVLATGSPAMLGLEMGDRLRGVVQPAMPFLGNSIGRLWAEGKPIDVASVMKSAWGGLLDEPDSAFARMNPGLRGQVEDAIARTKPVLDQHRIKQPGAMYEVDINADPDRFLHWDKPLSEQSEPVKAALRKLPWGEPYADSQTLTGASIAPHTAEGAAQLRDAGIAGIRYLDRASRAAGEGSHNLVMFDDKMIDIIRKYGVAGLIAGGGGLAAELAGGTDRENPFAGGF